MSYVDAVDTALTDSARTRTDLGTLISQVNSQSISLDEARARIDTVIEQRRSLLNAVTTVPPPSPLVGAAQLLRQSLVLALADDAAIRDWIEAVYYGDTASAQRYWQQQLALSSRASTAKAGFLARYNAIRRRLLRVEPHSRSRFRNRTSAVRGQMRVVFDADLAL